jgi:hypothetical protein
MILSKKKLSFAIILYLLTQVVSAASGSGIKAIPMPHVMAGLVQRQSSKGDRGLLYASLNAADREEGIDKSARFLDKSIRNLMGAYLEQTTVIDKWGFAVQLIFLALIEKLIRLKVEGEEDCAKALSQEIKVTRNTLFNILQPSLNDSNYSPRGSAGEITPRRKVPGTSYLRSLTPEAQKEARRAVKAEKKAALEAAKQDGLRHMQELFARAA